MLVAAMNPCPCGYFTDPNKPCKCSPPQIEKYLSRVSGPLIDRIDIHVEAPAVPWKELSRGLQKKEDAKPGTSSAEMRDVVLKARRRQIERQGAATPNSRLSGKQLDQLAPLSEDAKTMLGQAMGELGLSARAYDKIRRVSRTIADLADSDAITAEHVAEAVSYRLLDRKV
jgi:magnesium chelatase family protein